MNHQKRKRRRYFSSNLNAKKNMDLFLKTGVKGFICTCNGNEKQCVRESYNILNEYADQLFGEEILSNTSEVQYQHTDDDEMDAFQKEVQSLQKQTTENERRFQALDTGIANCIFIKTTVSDPVNLAYIIMHDIRKNKQAKSRFLIRMIPIEITCKAYMDDITDAIASLFDTHFTNGPFTYGINFSKRCNSNLDRNAVIDKLASMVQGRNNEHKVNLSNPQVTIIVEALKNICCLAVIKGYCQLNKYNLMQLCNASRIVDEQRDAKEGNDEAEQKSISEICDQADVDTTLEENSTSEMPTQEAVVDANLKAVLTIL